MLRVQLISTARRLAVLPVVALALLAGPAVAQATAPHPVVDNTTHQLKDAVTNTPLQLRGVNFTGSEYMCFDDTANESFDVPATTTTINRMKTWKINVVRVPINEDCWLGINGFPHTDPSDPPVMTAADYRQDIVDWVNLLVANNIAVLVNMHFYAPGTKKSEDQDFMADKDHAPAFWTSVASTFSGNPAVLFDLVNEPQMETPLNAAAWDCWKNGDASCSSYGPFGTLGMAGMDDLIAAVRGTGATNPVVADGIRYGNDLTGWLSHMPTDPGNQLIAGFHNYGDFAGCVGVTCYNTQVAPVNASVPVIAGEFGHIDDCDTVYPADFMNWADAQAHKVSYIAWAWTKEVCGDPALLKNLNGTPNAYGKPICTHYRALVGASACTTSSAPSAASSRRSAR